MIPTYDQLAAKVAHLGNTDLLVKELNEQTEHTKRLTAKVTELGGIITGLDNQIRTYKADRDQLAAKVEQEINLRKSVADHCAEEAAKLAAKVAGLETSVLDWQNSSSDAERELAQARAELMAAQATCERLRRDGERLDWLEHTKRGVFFNWADDPDGEPTRPIWAVDDAGIKLTRPDLRQAIDAAFLAKP